ncbi:MAG TPA: helix-turn-helix domain-containing protein [Ktedonobacteraceae bacterium]|nr:helix-turn-helix domain-containing protein [Ktedonobacteraceae bacterium]
MRPYLRVRSLSQEEYTQLKRMSISRKLCAGRVKRAQIILLSNQGHLPTEIDKKLNIHERTARRWIGRFNRLGIAGLEEGPREGRPRVYSTEEVGVVLQTALTPPSQLDQPFHSWTLDRLVIYLTEVKGIAIKRSRLSEIFRHEGLRWRHQEGWFGERIDPEFAQKRGPSKPSTPPLQTTV